MGVQQPHPDLPDILVGLGGAGKEVVKTILDQEWVVDSIAATGAAGGLPSWYLVDADTDRFPEDREVAEAATRRLEEAVHRQDNRIQGQVEDVVSALNLGEHLEQEDVWPPHLVHAAPLVLEETDVEAWWLSEDPAYIPEGFQGYTLRKRALAKALPPATRALTSGDPLDQIGLGGPGVTAVLVAGLGGGFGSGITLDLARGMDAAGTDVTLFGILPKVTDQLPERTNGHAALSELEYLALTDDNPFENIVLVPTPDDISEVQSFDEAIAYAVLAHSNLPPNDRLTLDETQAAGPDRYAPFTIALPQVLRFEVETVGRTLAQTDDWLHERQHRLDVELDLYRKFADIVIEGFPNAQGPVIAHGADERAPPKEAPVEAMDEPYDVTDEEAVYLLLRVEELLEMLEGDLFEALDIDVALDWFHAIEQAKENAQANADDDNPRDDLANLVVSIRHLLLNDPVQGEPNDTQMGQLLHDTVRKELQAVVLRSRIHRAAHQIDDAVYREGILRAIDEDWRGRFQGFQSRLEELDQQIRDRRKRLEAVERIRHEMEERVEHDIAVFEEETHDAIETLVLIARHSARILDILHHVEDQINAFISDVEGAAHKDELPDDPLDSDVIDELNHLLGVVDIDPIDWDRLLVSAHAIVEAKAALLDHEGNPFAWFLSDWPERYEQAFEQVDPELFDIPTAEEAEQQFYCRFVGEHIFGRPRETIEKREEQAIEDVIRIVERVMDTSDLTVDDFQVPGEDPFEIDWSDSDDNWRREVRNFLWSISESDDPPSASQVLSNLVEPGGIIRVAIERAVLSPVDRALDTVHEDVEAAEARYDRVDQMVDIAEGPGIEFAMRESDAQFPAPGTDLGLPHRPTHHARTVSEIPETLFQFDSLSEADHPDVRVAIEEFLDHTANPFQHLDDRVGLVAGDVVGESDMGPVPYDGHRIVRAHIGRVFDDDSNPPTDDTLADIADAVGAGENFVDRHFGFGDPWEVAAVTFIGGVFLDNLAPVTDRQGYRDAYGASRNNLGERVRVHHAHGLDGRDRSLIESGNDAGFVYRDRVLDVHDHATMGEVIATDEHEAVEWLLEECVATESFAGESGDTPGDDAESPN